MPFTRYTSLDFDDIKTSIKDYIRSNSNFTDYDFEGSNLSIIIDMLAYNTYITAFNTNMVANEAFLDSAVLRENVVSLARTIGYVPRSKVAAQSQISFSVQVSEITPSISLESGIVCVGNQNDSRYIFSIPTDISTSVIDGVATFNNITVYQGNLINQRFDFDASLEQKFILDNEGIDTSTLNVYVRNPNGTGLGIKYLMVDNIIKIDKNSEIYLIQEVTDERYELLFGDGFFGKKLDDGSVITASYIQTDGDLGNDVANFVYQGTIRNSNGTIITPSEEIVITTNQTSRNGSDIESVSSIKYFAPRLFSSQYRAVTNRDYESIISNQIYPNVEYISVVGGEELDPPEFGTVVISIKPKNGITVSEFDKEQILLKLKNYSMAGINARIEDVRFIYVEIDSSIYYNDNAINSAESVRNDIIKNLETYSSSLNNSATNRFKYSKLISLIDNTSRGITSNITKVLIRRNLFAVTNQFSQYELCFGNRFYANRDGYNIKSTGFTVRVPSSSGTSESETVYFTDIPGEDLTTGVISIVKPAKNVNDPPVVVVPSAGTVDYIKGEIIINSIYFISTVKPNNIIEIQAVPESNDVLALKDLYLLFDVSKSKINMVKDVIASGDDVSGIQFSRDSFRSSYSNGNLQRF